MILIDDSHFENSKVKQRVYLYKLNADNKFRKTDDTLAHTMLHIHLVNLSLMSYY